jgi:hypothetical protein
MWEKMEENPNSLQQHRLYEMALDSAGRWDDKDFTVDFGDVVGITVAVRQPIRASGR